MVVVIQSLHESSKHVLILWKRRFIRPKSNCIHAQLLWEHPSFISLLSSRNLSPFNECPISLLRDHFLMVQSTVSKFSFHPDTCYDVTRNSTKALRSEVCLLFIFFSRTKSCSSNNCSITLFLICYKY